MKRKFSCWSFQDQDCPRPQSLATWVDWHDDFEGGDAEEDFEGGDAEEGARCEGGARLDWLLSNGLLRFPLIGDTP